MGRMNRLISLKMETHLNGRIYFLLIVTVLPFSSWCENNFDLFPTLTTESSHQQHHQCSHARNHHHQGILDQVARQRHESVQGQQRRFPGQSRYNGRGSGSSGK